MASSREGTITSAWVPVVLSSINANKGSRNPSVLPEPVSASSTRSWFSWPAFRAALCNSFISSILRGDNSFLTLPGFIIIRQSYVSQARLLWIHCVNGLGHAGLLWIHSAKGHFQILRSSFGHRFAESPG